MRDMILMKDIIDDTNPLIREISEPVSLPLSDEDQQLALEMYEYLKNSQDEDLSEKYQLRPGVGLAAIQLGIKKRMCAILVYDFDDEGNIIDETSYVLVNPKIISYSERKAYLKDGEGCLSVLTEHQGYVPRHHKITVTAYDALTKQDIRIVVRGYLAIVFQHEFDHFDGRLFYDRIDKKYPFKPIPNAVEIE